MQDSAFVRLQLLPLFQGISKDELLRMLERAKFNFVSAESGEILFERGAAATQLVYILSGRVTATRTFSEGLQVIEDFDAPMLFQPECMFGPTPTWRHDLVANTDVQMLQISKQDTLNHLMDFLTFRMALLNYLCGLTEKEQVALAQPTPTTLSGKIVEYLSRRATTPSGKKIFKVGMKSLATRLSTSRLAVSRSLNAFERAGVVSLGRETIMVNDFQQLLAFYRTQVEG